MTTVLSPSSASPNDDDHRQIPTATLALPSVAAASSSRRLPPPCWTPDETVALVDAYRDKWYSLSRGNLRANHWQEVADEVASQCPATPPKTAVQCRHKMEKLRKRYRAEIQRAAAHGGVRRYASSWALFQNMHAMETGPNKPSPPSSSSDDNEEEDDFKNNIKPINGFHNHSNNNQKGIVHRQGFVDNGAASAFRIKIPGGVNAGPSMAKVYSKFDGIGGQNPNPRFTNSVPSGYGVVPDKGLRNQFVGRGEMGLKRKKVDDGVDEVVEAIQALGEGFVRIEKAKMDMVRQMEEMRMEMELKRTEMMLDSQRRIVEALAKAIAERSTKKAKKMPAMADS